MRMKETHEHVTNVLLVNAMMAQIWSLMCCIVAILSQHIPSSIHTFQGGTGVPGKFSTDRNDEEQILLLSERKIINAKENFLPLSNFLRES